MPFCISKKFVVNKQFKIVDKDKLVKLGYLSFTQDEKLHIYTSENTIAVETELDLTFEASELEFGISYQN